jgi:hypothetical protein
LFESAYSSNGVYNQLFRREIHKFVQANAKQLQSMNGFMRMEGGESSAEKIANETTMISLLQRFTKLGMKQIQVICKLHCDDLKLWEEEENPSPKGKVQSSDPRSFGGSSISGGVASSFGASSSNSGSGGDASSFAASSSNSGGSSNFINSSVSAFSSVGPVSNGSRNQQPLDSIGKWAVSTPAASLAKASLRHIGRVDSDLLFLANLATTLIDMQQTPSATPLREAAGASGVEPLPQSETQSLPQASPSPEPVESPLGEWELCGSDSALSVDQYWADMGYSWFVRQLTNRLVSVIRIEETEAKDGLTATPCGKFMGMTVLDAHLRMPPPFFPRHGACSHGPTYKFREIPERQPDAPKILKLADRLINTHTTGMFADGSGRMDYLSIDPKRFFATERSIQQIFSREGLGSWVEDLKQTNEHGLPVNMVKSDWIRRTFEYVVENNPEHGGRVMRQKCCCYEYDPASDGWCIVRAAMDIQRRPRHTAQC